MVFFASPCQTHLQKRCMARIVPCLTQYTHMPRSYSEYSIEIKHRSILRHNGSHHRGHCSLPSPRLLLATPSSSSPDNNSTAPLVAVEGDIVEIHWTCMNQNGEELENSRLSADEPTTFEVGAGDIVGNRLFEAFDDAVRGLAVGEIASIRAQGGEWQPELLFRVPAGHEEVTRLQGRYKNMGGLKEGLVVELSNGGMAVVIDLNDNELVLDANNMLAGKELTFDIELVSLEKKEK
jgi:FKBP-type peptidyl-prolyl cis-trans isomerase 2